MVISNRSFSQYLATISCVLGIMMTASSTVWYNPIQVVLFSKDSPVKLMLKEEYAAIIAARQLGAIVGAFPAGTLANKWGRKTILLLAFPCTAVGWLMTDWATSLPQLLIARFMHGIAGGIMVVLCSVYISEICEPRLRGCLCPFTSLAWSVGMMWDFCLGPILTYYEYLSSEVLPAVLFLGTFLMMPESPYYLTMMRRDEEAEQALTWLRGGDAVKEELEEIRRTVENDLSRKRGDWQDLVSRHCRAPFFVANVVVAVKFLTGMKALEVFSTGTLQSLGVNSPTAGTALLGVTHVSTSLVAIWVNGSCPRRPLLLFSMFLLGVVNLMLGLCSLLGQEARHQYADWFLLMGLLFCVATFRLGISAPSDLLPESFPTHVRPTLSAFIMTMGNCYILTSVVIYRYLEDNFGAFSNYFFFSFVSFAGLIALVPTMQETSFKSLGEIQEDIRIKKMKSRL